MPSHVHGEVNSRLPPRRAFIPLKKVHKNDPIAHGYPCPALSLRSRHHRPHTAPRVLSDCHYLRSTVQPLYSRFPNRFSSCFSEAAIGYDPNRTADVISTATNAPPHPDGRLHGGSDPLVHLRARFGCPRLLSGAEEMYCIVNAECRMHTAECTLQNAHCRMQNAECKYYMYR